MSAILPLFPLQLVLLPTTPQLLHVFEPRYQRLLKDCQKGDGRFGLSRLPPERATPEPGDIGCSALISSHQPLPDGRSNILAIGERRFVIEAILETDTPYHEGRVQYFDDLDRDDPEVARAAVRVWRAFRDLQIASGREAPSSYDLSDRPADMSFVVAGALNLSLDVKESLVRLTSARERFRRLVKLIAEATNRAKIESAMAERAQGNGRGDHPPHLVDPT